MHKFEPILRYLLALALLVFGANEFFHFMPQPEAPPEGAEFMGKLQEAGYVFPAVGIAFIVAGLCLLLGMVALGLVVVAPILVNILLYHLRYDPPGIVMGRA